MRRLINMYLYRFVRSIAVWICLALSVTIVMTPALARLYSPSHADSGFSAASALIQAAQSCFPMMLCGIGLSVFFHEDEKHGFIKNIMPVLKRPEAIISARLLITAVMAFAMYLLIYLQEIIVSLLMFSGKIGFTVAEIGTFCTAYLLTVAFLSLITMLTLLTRGTSVPIVCNVVCSVGVISLVMLVANVAINRLTPFKHFDLTMYTASGSLSSLVTEGSHLREIIVSVVYLLLSSAADIFTLRRRDTR